MANVSCCTKFLKRQRFLAALIVILSGAFAGIAPAQTCNGSLTSSIAPGNPHLVGDTVRVTLGIGGSGQGATFFEILADDGPGALSGVRFALDCRSDPLVCIPGDQNTAICTNDNTSITYVGNITTNCVSAVPGAITWTASVVGNVVEFDPNVNVRVATPGGGFGSCSLEFDITLATVSGDAVPNILNSAATYQAFCSNGLNGNACGTLEYQVESCEVRINKEVSCDGGVTWFDDPGPAVGAVSLVEANEDGTGFCAGFNAFNGTPASQIQVRYQASNAGSVALDGCIASETNTTGDGAGFPAAPALPATIAIGATTPFTTPSSAACSDLLEVQEPNTASISCHCAGFDAETTASAFDTASFECQSPGLQLEKTCTGQSGGLDTVSVTATNTGNSALANCTMTDNVYQTDPTCPADVGVGTPVALAPVGAFNLAVAGNHNKTGTTPALAAEACNLASVTCDVVGAPPGTTITSTADDLCEVQDEGCITRTPGFWKNHKLAVETIIAAPGDVVSCGITLTKATANTAAGQTGSSVEEMCVNGTEAKAANTSMSQLQLMRQCMAANLNVAVSTIAELDCNAAVQGIETTIGECCNNVGSVCRAGLAKGQPGVSGRTLESCIGALDAFNNQDFADEDLPFAQGPAAPAECQAANKNKLLNTGARTLGPK